LYIVTLGLLILGAAWEEEDEVEAAMQRAEAQDRRRQMEERQRREYEIWLANMRSYEAEQDDKVDTARERMEYKV
jgi:hypothetical protein